RASMHATTRDAPLACASASSVDTPSTGSERASAMPCARPQAIRRPVKDPGPAPNTTAFRSEVPDLVSFNNLSSIGIRSSECRFGVLRSMAEISPSRHSATEHHSVEVSRAAKSIADSIYCPPMQEHSIAEIPGDGIGREVMPEGVRVLEAAGARHGLRFK